MMSSNSTTGKQGGIQNRKIKVPKQTRKRAAKQIIVEYTKRETKNRLGFKKQT